ncbi:2-amino-4-hydroxy-6-hydroxymethyldihydropteridine diphosphokinase [Paenibacillus phyllosphaerae]|uniref:2-amino-4-hydroxy-6-hydroxymethyldihydropteridine diphosphokinase n=1 Tax=Paenibacillus phyllosphaerae TaxID=274593 RepID=A0A7W5FRA8_9BACL|nr:2-amino-4-hydroxy-6-hydroxymethyldihydropteridine diphosphokinase [Paenibacillus phyllosphaerae]MBB3114148.1 2-amino-4-hydroxy-6-hydroxymethyldihydropteridine diphosphokinase [Paenibacillus phyllosphaerae]
MEQGDNQLASGTAYIALGSNLGERDGYLTQALHLLDQRIGIAVLRVSGIYETDPVGYTDQPAFLNMAAAVRTTLTPIELLRTLLEVELALGRTREVHWGPRTIDLDLLLFDDVVMEEDELTLPHPRMLERAFVLVPLRDVLQSGHPLHALTSQAADRALQDGGEGIALWNTINWHSASAPSGN